MAIRDALWACPFCREIDAIRPGKEAEACARCGATFRPGPDAVIIAGPPGSPPETRSVSDWEARLPVLEDAAESTQGPRSAILRRATAARPVRFHGNLLGWAERFGPKTAVTLELDDRQIRIRSGSDGEETWDLADVTAVQPSSSSVQLRRRDGELVSLAFPDGSVRLWEARLQAAVRRAYRHAGRGEITEFHPTIRTAG